ncbi:MAG TPA: hypothetical protein DCR52_01305, partial [Actinobacteria bacterium]|nr:hypothetical protein [Actinomycetota bacterium]
MFWPEPHSRVRSSYLLIASSLAFGWSANAGNLALSTADRYLKAGEQLVVAVSVEGQAVDGVGAQIVLNYDATKLSFASRSTPGALDLPIYELDSAGVYKIALGTSTGNTDVEVAGTIALPTFNVTGEFADASGLVSFGGSGRVVSKISNAAGSAVVLGAATDLGPVTRDVTAPVMTAAPSNRLMWADANGSGQAVAILTAPTATDNVDSAPVIVRTRAGNVDSSDNFPAGAITTVVWTATDNCGNQATRSASVDVSASSIARLDVGMAGAFVANNFNRGVEIVTGSETIPLTVPMACPSSTRAIGNVDFQLSGASDYAADCAAIRDPLHSVSRTATVAYSAIPGSSGSRDYNSRYLVNPVSDLSIGNANGDAVIDILDFSAFVVQRGGQLPLDTSSSSVGPHTDFNASSDGTGASTALDVTNADLSFLAVNFFAGDETCGAFNNQQPLARIRVKDLRRMGLVGQEMADLNGDGWVDTTDIALMMQGVEPRRPTPTQAPNVANVT